MKQVSEMPTSGQFVAVFEFKDGKIASETLKWDSCGHLLVLMSDGFHEECAPDFYGDIGAAYFIAD
jgi:hypothetical protein